MMQQTFESHLEDVKNTAIKLCPLEITSENIDRYCKAEAHIIYLYINYTKSKHPNQNMELLKGEKSKYYAKPSTVEIFETTHKRKIWDHLWESAEKD